MEEEGEDLTPFWVQSSANRRRNRLPSSSLFLNSGVLLFALCIAAILFLFFIIPSILSLTAQIFRPNLLRKSWDSLNIVLVLFALIFGFLSRNKNYDSSFEHQSDSKITSEVHKSITSTPRGWYEHTDRTAVAGLRRTYSSYPDLREISPSHGPDDQWRFFDDMQVDAYRYSDADQLRRRRSWKRTGDAEEEVRSDSSKTIYVDTLVTRAKEVTYTPPPEASPQPPPPADVDRTTNRTNESVVREERESKQVNDDLEREEYRAPPPSKPPQAVRRRPRRTSEKLSKQANNFELQNFGTPAVLSPPQSVHRKTKRTHESVARKDEASKQVNYYSESEEYQASTSELVPDRSLSPPAAAYSEKRNSKSERRSGGSATKDFLTSLYHQRKKKKKQRQKSIDNFETLLQPEPPLSLVPPPSPPPPPPPPPPSTFYSISSSKKGKIKKIISIPPPPPPPPPSYSAARASKSTAPIVPTKTRRPPLPVKLSNFHGVEETSNSGGESPLTGCDSPLHPIPPPPPPPPPFKMPSWKFLVKGDYVKIGSMNSTRSVSPEPDEVESPTSEMSSEASETPTSVDGGEAAAVPFGPSLDVNTKADMFIAKFRAGLKLQKMNSMKRKQGVGFSNLGPLTKPGSGP